ncbi:testis-specific Y-encoded-like protein 2 [Nycticebus coucang]|uniref:testis-specific Y-encoded-like protein 2 n=1 Tax=Nycticebus coucang TaxID=9470 RepID=UPI00234C72F5|nr:testis-specific Y-encoded-like protein 2 [Nycticebus coucang]
MDLSDEGPPAKTRRLSSSEPPQRDPPPPPPPPPPLVRLPLPPPQQRPRLREETEAAQVLADMRGVGLGLALPPPPPYVILEEGGIRAYFTLGAGGPDWESTIESGYGEAPPPTGSLDTLTPSEVSGGSLEIDFQVTEPSSSEGEKALETCSAVGWGPQRLVGPKSREEAVILVEDEDEDELEGLRRSSRRRRRRRRKQRKMKKDSKERNSERMESILQALENIQLDLEAVNIKAGKAFLRLKRKFIQMRRPFLERRDLIIQHIPGFWVKAFLNHPRISILINQRDEDIFRYLTNLQVQDLRHISMGYKMKLYFQTNPYFTNMVIVKEFQRNRSGRLVSHSTPIRWHRGQEPQAHRHGNQDTSHSFFSWFSNHSLPEADRIAEIIKNDLWVNPLRYYMMREGGYRTNRKKKEEKKSKTKDECEVVIVEDAYDYYAVEDIFSEISDIDETIHDIKISDFMETTDYFETTDNEITDINENICDSESPDQNEVLDNKATDNESTDDETADNNESASNNSENPKANNKNTDDNKNPDNKNEHADGDSKNLRGNQGSSDNNQDSSDSDNEGDEGSDDEDNDGNEGDNEGSDDDGNEGDNEGSDDDDRDIEYYENNIEDFDKDQDFSINQDDYEDEIEIITEESVGEEEEEEGSEQEGEDFYEEGGYVEEGSEDDWEGEDSEDSDLEEVLEVPNVWANPGKKGKTG